MTVPLVDYAGLPGPRARRLESDLADRTTLGQLLDWTRQHEPPLAVREIVTQDEFTHDVVIPYVDGVSLVFDVT